MFNEFELTLFVGRMTRQMLVNHIIHEVLNGKIKDIDEATDLLIYLIDSDRASDYLRKYPERIIIP